MIAHAHRVLDWQENLTDDEMPPEWMWPLEEELAIWFEKVNREREEKYGGGSSSDEPTSVPMVSNEFAEGRR